MASILKILYLIMSESDKVKDLSSSEDNELSQDELKGVSGGAAARGGRAKGFNMAGNIGKVAGGISQDSTLGHTKITEESDGTVDQ